ncbi:MAG: TIGR03986 family CRISPR-associated RAMP protein [Anaerolineae bacterium]|nr:TIGR03986 family CRISPR-associated RAMP protein [Anaerolineae bacterium]
MSKNESTLDLIQQVLARREEERRQGKKPEIEPAPPRPRQEHAPRKERQERQEPPARPRREPKRPDRRESRPEPQPAARPRREPGRSERRDSRPDARRATQPPAQGGARFLNPYNFVRYLDKRPNGVLGDCPPPPHDRYVGLTGRITCAVEAVTPLFVSDSHCVDEIEIEVPREDGNGNVVKKHRRYRFFQYEEQPALPASSLRGMVRSVYEAATNSCFGVFEGNTQLEFRERPDYGNQVKSFAGVIRQLAQPSKDKHLEIEGSIDLCQVGQVGAYYGGNNAWKNVLHCKSNGDAWKSGERVVARARRRRRDWLILQIAETQGALDPLSADEEYVEGWLKITGRSGDTNKCNETLFLDPQKYPGTPRSLAFGYETQKEYNQVLAHQIQQGDLPVPPQASTLNEDTLVWVEPDSRNHPKKAKRIVRVQVPRTPYKNTLERLLAEHLHTCLDYKSLCPACRLFGWVHSKPPKEASLTAYAGRLRFSHGAFAEGQVLKDLQMEDIPLAILGTPKPTTTQFYLGRKSGEGAEITADAAVDYNDEEARLRGRKFYRHVGDGREMTEEQRAQFKQEYTRAPKASPIRDDQNRTVRGALKPGAKFTFTVDFENLAPVELGGLLWTLQLEEGMYHRLGYAKPLGFGSIKVMVGRLELLSPAERYGEIGVADGWQECEDIAGLVEKFKAAMGAAYGSFDDALNSIQDLRALLTAPEPPPLPIHYPRLESEPAPEGKNFRWFMANKRSRPPKKLELAAEDKDGLPINPNPHAV